MFAAQLGLQIILTCSQPQEFVFSQVHMGVEFRLTLFHSKPAEAQKVAKLCFAKLKQLDETLSDYQENSELNTVLRAAGSQPVQCSDELFELLSVTKQVHHETGGIFDPTVAPLTKLWRVSRKSNLLPKMEELIAAKALVGLNYVTLDPKLKSIFLQKPGVLLDFGGIGKGYACDKVMEILKKNGFKSALIEGGGDIACIGSPPNKPGWPIKIAGSQQAVWLKDNAMSTSGSTEQFVEIESRLYSHILDPRTGLGISALRQVTVIAPKGVQSDPYATALCIQPNLRIPKSLKIFVVERSL